MKRFSKPLVLLALFLAGEMLPLFSQSSLVVRKPTGDDYWYILKEAQDAYDFGNYGNCIALAEKAKAKRKEQIKWEQYTLDQSQRLVIIRNAGDELKNVTKAMEDAKQKNALAIVNQYLETYGSGKFKGSFSALLKFINQNNSYPEADYLIGRVYKLEGEASLATVYLKRPPTCFLSPPYAMTYFMILPTCRSTTMTTRNTSWTFWPMTPCSKRHPS